MIGIGITKCEKNFVHRLGGGSWSPVAPLDPPLHNLGYVHVSVRCMLAGNDDQGAAMVLFILIHLSKHLFIYHFINLLHAFKLHRLKMSIISLINGTDRALASALLDRNYKI